MLRRIEVFGILLFCLMPLILLITGGHYFVFLPLMWAIHCGVYLLLSNEVAVGYGLVYKDKSAALRELLPFYRFSEVFVPSAVLYGAILIIYFSF